MKKLFLVLCLVPVFAFASRRLPNVHYSNDAKVVNAPVDCGGQEFDWFSLQKSDLLPTPPSFADGGLTYNLQAPNEQLRLRLDVCLDTKTNQMTLKRLVVLEYPSSAMIVDVAADADVKGLSKALSEQNYDGLHIELPLDPSTHFLLESRRGPKGSFVTGVRTILQDGKWSPASIDFLAGEFAYGNAFEAGRCQLNQLFGTSSFRLGTALFVAEYCAYQGSGETTDYDFIGLSVTDSNPALGAQAGKTVAFHSADELKPVLVYRHNHHNACDSFHLTLPGVEYAATTAPVAGCGIAVPDAPARTFSDTERAVRYRVKYGQGAWTDALMTECGHYLFGCKVPGTVLPESAFIEMVAIQAPPYLNKLVDNDFASLAHTEDGYTYVKYSLQLASDAIYFQDTNRYPFHFAFLKNELPQYKDLASDGYDDLLFTPGKKELSAGALYYDSALRVPEYSSDGLLGFSVYFKDTFDVAEIARVYGKLTAAAPFAGGHTAYAFDRRADYFKYKSKLWPATCNGKAPSPECIPSLPLDRFKK